MGSVPDYLSKARVTVNHTNFRFPRMCNSYTVLQSPKCVIALCLKHNVHALI